MAQKKRKTTDRRASFKPFDFPWAYDHWQQHERMHWLHDEVPLHQDVVDYTTKLTKIEQEFITQILRFFTQGDCDVEDYYVKNILPNFNNIEINMMAASFAARETIHVAAYSLLVETLGLPETTYSQFLEYEEMVAKHDYVDQFMLPNVKDAPAHDIALSLAIFSGFIEGVQLFSSFVMLMNFARSGHLIGVGKIITMSMRDENKHCEGMTQLFKQYVRENRLLDDDLKGKIYSAAETIVTLEDAFIDLAYAGQDVMRDLAKSDLKTYIRYIADKRLLELGLKPIFKQKNNPLPWVSVMMGGMTNENFFESKGIEYSKQNFDGVWGDVWNHK